MKAAVAPDVDELVPLIRDTSTRPLKVVENGAGKPQGLAAVRLDAVEMRSIEWLAKPFLQRSAFQLVAGPKGVGKGTWIARITANMTMGVYGDPRNVLLVSSEDSAAIDIRPRLRAAGGDDSRVHLVNSVFALPRDLDAMRDLARDIGDVGLIAIDPLGNHLGGVDTDKEGAIRHALHGLNDLADDLDATVLGVRHIGKARQNGALAAVLGSVAFVDLPRAVLMFAPDDEDDSVFHAQVVAGNRSGRSAAQAYRIELRDVGLAERVTYAVELGETGKHVDQLLASGGTTRGTKRANAKEIILRELSKGPQTMEHLKAVGAAEDISGDTVWRAANELKAEGKAASRNKGRGTPWHWFLTEDETT